MLVVDDDPAVGKVLEGLLRQSGHDAQWVSSASAALEVLDQRFIGLVISDIQMPNMDGLELLTRIKQGWPDVPVVMLTAHGTVTTAVEAMKRGASDFIQKPFERDEILYVVKKELTRNTSAPAEAAPAGGLKLGSSAAMRECDELLTRAARSPATVLLRGESGVGKELAAHAIHDRSKRSTGPFVVVHPTALAEQLLESELFGHEKGAFTGAVSRKPGRVELAEGGTLFLDELGDLSATVQLKLLRLIQERQFERVGGTQTLTADVRFVAATHRNLEAMVAEGKFREDLFFRLNVIPIRIPPLRDRGEDVGPLAVHFCREHGGLNDRPNAALTDDALALLQTQPWKGNVRQLKNFVERLVVMSDADRIDAAVVSRELSRSAEPPLSASVAAPVAIGGEASLDQSRSAAERAAIQEALSRAGGNRTKAARLLGVARRTLYNKLDELGIDAKR
ncbi:MAG: frgC [Myxococcaceae bacterium]|nr:frgC [Myxococcaceae bacterium]